LLRVSVLVISYQDEGDRSFANWPVR